MEHEAFQEALENSTQALAALGDSTEDQEMIEGE
jgi:hypothetical protein